MWDLCRQLVIGESRNEADHGPWDFACNDDQIGLGKGKQIAEAVEAPGESFQPARIAQRVERAFLDAEAQGFGGPQRATVLAKQSNCCFSGCRSAQGNLSG